MAQLTPDEINARVDQIIANIKYQMQNPNRKELTSLQLRDRADRLRTYAHQTNRAGYPVREEYL